MIKNELNCLSSISFFFRLSNQIDEQKNQKYYHNKNDRLNNPKTA